MIRRLTSTGLILVQKLTQLFSEDSNQQSKDVELDDTLFFILERNEILAIRELIPLILKADPDQRQKIIQSIEYLYKTVPLQALPQLDEQLRHGFGYQIPEGWQKLTVASIEQFKIHAPYNAMIWGLLSCHPNGYLREQACRRLIQFQTGEEISFLLLRVNDWVEPIRTLAQTAIESRFKPSNLTHFLERVLLISCLEIQQRHNLRDITQAIYHFLLESANQNEVLSTLSSAPLHDRRKLYQLCLNSADNQFLISVLKIGLRDPDNHIRFWNGRFLIEQSNINPEPYLHQLKYDRFMPNRRLYLNYVIEHQSENSGKVLNECLLDQHASIRELARFHLRKRGKQEFADIYRDKLEQSNKKVQLIALRGLTETGKAEDVPLFLKHLNSETAVFRQIALRGLVRHDGEKYLETILLHLADGSKKVSNEAKNGLIILNGVYRSREKLLIIFKQTAYLHTKVNILHLFGHLPKWDALIYLLKAEAHSETGLDGFLDRHFKKWMANTNQSFTTLSSQQVDTIMQHLLEVGEAFPHYKKIKLFLEDWRKTENKGRL